MCKKTEIEERFKVLKNEIENKTQEINDFTINMPLITLAKIQHIADIRKVNFYECIIALVNERVDMLCVSNIMMLTDIEKGFTEKGFEK